MKQRLESLTPPSDRRDTHSEYHAAKHELARYRAGDLSAPKPLPAPAKESAEAENRRHLTDMRRTDEWLRYGPGQTARSSAHTKAMEQYGRSYLAHRAASGRIAREQEAERRAARVRADRLAIEKSVREATQQRRDLARSKPYEQYKWNGPAPARQQYGVVTTVNLRKPEYPATLEEYRRQEHERQQRLRQPAALNPTPRAYPELPGKSLTSQTAYNKGVAEVSKRFERIAAAARADAARSATRTPDQQRQDAARNTLRVRTLAGRVHDAEIDHQHAVLAVRATEPGTKAYDAARTRAKAVYAKQESLRAEMNRAYQDELAKLGSKSGKASARANAATPKATRAPSPRTAVPTGKTLEALKSAPKFSESQANKMAQYIYAHNPDWQVNAVAIGHGTPFPWIVQVSKPGHSTYIGNWKGYQEQLALG